MAEDNPSEKYHTIIEVPRTMTREVIEYNDQIPKLCAHKYPKHPRGCPNYGNKKGCPPGLPLIDQVLDFDKSIYIIYTEFPLGQFVEEMKEKHPDTLKTIPQQYNLRYWQPRARKIQRAAEEEAQKSHHLDQIIQCAEGHGVNLDATMRNVGVPLNWEYPPKEHDPNYTRFLISLGGFNK